MSQIDRRQALQLLAALGATGVTGLAASCSTDPTAATATDPVSEEPITIGMIAPRTGGYKPIGDEMVNGFQFFLDLNEQRLGGHPVNLVIADEGETVATGKAALDGLLKQNVQALTGVATPPVMLAIRDAVERARVPLIGSNASPAALQSVVYIWRTSYVDGEAGKAIGPYVASKVSRTGQVLIVAPETDNSQDIITGFRQGFEAPNSRLSHPVVWTSDSINPSKSTYSGQIDAILSAEPEALFCCHSGDAAVMFLKQLHAAGYRGKIFGPGFLTEGTVLSELKPAECQGIETSLNYSADLNNDVNRRFASTYRKAHGAPPTTYAMASYDAAQVLDAAIRIAGSKPTAQQVNLAIGKVGQIDSPRGPWQFNQSRTPAQKWYLRRVQPDGQVISNVVTGELTTLG